MDNLDRMFRHLVRTIETRKREYLSRPFEVIELHQTILPYRLHRRELGLETNHDYELTLLELLSGARGYLVVDDRMRDALRKELASANPDPSVMREFAGAHVALASDAVRRLDTLEGRDGARADPSPDATPVVTPAVGAHVTPRRGPTSQPRAVAVAPAG